MFYLNQKSEVPVPDIPVAEFPYLRSPASSRAPQTQETPTAIDPLVSANDAGAADDGDDEGPRKWYQIRFHNPLWVIAAAMGFLFTVMAFFVALS
jgi:hypothetical protein